MRSPGGQEKVKATSSTDSSDKFTVPRFTGGRQKNKNTIEFWTEFWLGVHNFQWKCMQRTYWFLVRCKAFWA